MLPDRFRLVLVAAAMAILLVGGLIARAVISATSSPSTPNPTSPAALALATRGLPRQYVIRPGDAYASIARATHLSVSQLKALNPKQDPNVLVPGHPLELHLPVARAHAHQKVAPRFWTVRPGDTYSSIAAQTGVPPYEIAAYNPRVNPNTLSPGRRLKLRP